MDCNLTDPALVKELIERTRPLLRRIFAAYRVPASDAEDILQEALIVTLEKWPFIRSHSPWLCKVVRLKCMNYWREKKSARLQMVDLDFLEALAPPVPPSQEREEMLLDLEHLALSLPPKQRRLLQMRYLEGHTTRECATQLGYDFSSVRKLSCRAKDKIIDALALSRFDVGEDPKVDEPPGPVSKIA